MENYAKSINDHYSQVNLGTSIIAAYENAGKNVAGLTREDITTFDEFHIRGREATREVAQLAGLQKDMKVLDLGCGVGGSARTLAAEFGCIVTGIDLVDEYCQTAEMLTDRVGLSDRVSFQQGNVMEMPFEDESFDVAWLQHVSMNIENKTGLYREVHRVLKPKGLFALYEICAGHTSQPYFPVPWASDASINFLAAPETLQQMLSEIGFKEKVWKDVTSISLEWFRNMIASMSARPTDAPPLLGLNLLMGKTTKDKVNNLTRNLAEDRVRVIQGVFEVIT